MFNAHIATMIKAKIYVLYRERERAFQNGNASDYNIFDQLANDQFDKLAALES